MSSNTPPTRLGVVTRSPAGTLDVPFQATSKGSQPGDECARAFSMGSVSNTIDLASRQDMPLDPSIPLTVSTIQSSVSPPPIPPIRTRTATTLKPAGCQLEMCKEIDGLVPVTTEMEYERYSRGFTYKKEYNHYSIPACTRSFPGPSIPPQWTTYVHPEGMRYFFKKTRIYVSLPCRISMPVQRLLGTLPPCYHLRNNTSRTDYWCRHRNPQHISVLTEARIDEPDQLSAIEHYLSEITSFISNLKNHDVLAYLQVSSPSGRSDLAAPSSAPKDSQDCMDEEPRPRQQGQLEGMLLVLELRASGNCGYYFVDHGHQCLFWLDPFDFSHLVDQVRIQHSSGLVGLQMKSHYWYHNELFPHLYQLTPENLNEIEDILTFAVGDVATSGSSSTINHDLETLKLMHSMVLGFQLKDRKIQAKSIGGAWFIFRLFTTFYGERFISLYGEKGARLTSSQSIHSSRSSSDSWFLSLLSPFMFLGPSIHAKRLKNLTLDSVVSKRDWSKLRGRLVDEWREGVLYATVVLTANVAFLTIQSVDEASGPGYRSPAQRACDFSIVTSMGTIMWGLVLGREYRESMSTAFIANRSASRAGIEMLAIVYSLPYALLMWSMLAFFISFCITWYSSGDRVVVVLISAACGLVALLIAWGAAIKYEKEPYWGLSPRWARRAWAALNGWIRKRKGGEETRRVSTDTSMSDETIEKG